MHISKSCTVGLIKSCDNDGNPGISKQEWFTCFKTEGVSIRHTIYSYSFSRVLDFAKIPELHFMSINFRDSRKGERKSIKFSQSLFRKY